MTQSQARDQFPSSGLQPLSQEALQVPFAVGDVIADKYEVVGLLGSGGMGYVISARHTELGEMVALKFLRPEALAHAELVERFAREARAAAKIRSEHVANVFDVGTLTDGTPFIVMEYLAGQDLADHLHQEGALPISVAVEYIMQACEALAAAHAHGIVHRDIKPENLFLTQQAQGMQMIKVLDFGISKIALPRGKRDLVRTQMALGSPVYMSPEQIRSSDQVDARSDIWAVGCVLFELLTGVTAFDEPSLLELSAAILEREPVPLQTLRPDASEELEQIVLRCLTKDPADRFQNVAELAAALFPFGPRRARISAERCYHMLKNAGMVADEITLASAFPPALESGRVMTGALKARPSRATTTPALDILVDDDDEVTRLAKPRRRSTPLILGLSIAAVAAGFIALRTRSAEPTTAASAAASAPRPVEQARQARPAAEPRPATVLDLDTAEPAPAARTAAPTVSAKSGPASNGNAKAAKAPRPVHAPAAPGKRARGSDDELDPGF